MKHVPQRTCVACRKTASKRELIRLVRTADSSVDVDTGGKEKGRGAYLCPAWACWETGLKRGRVEHALRTNLTEENRQRLIIYAEGLLLGESHGRGR